jgi:hypothetical protein
VKLATWAVLQRLGGVVQVVPRIRPQHLEEAYSSEVQPEDRMVDDGEGTRDGSLDIDHGSAAGRDESGLNTAGRWANEIPFTPHFVEDLANYVEAADEVRASVTDKETNGLSSTADDGLLSQGTFTAIEDNRRWALG